MALLLLICFFFLFRCWSERYIKPANEIQSFVGFKFSYCCSLVYTKKKEYSEFIQYSFSFTYTGHTILCAWRFYFIIYIFLLFFRSVYFRLTFFCDTATKGRWKKIECLSLCCSHGICFPFVFFMCILCICRILNEWYVEVQGFSLGRSYSLMISHFFFRWFFFIRPTKKFCNT